MDLVPDISLNVIVNVFLLSTMHQIVGPNKSVLKKKLFYFLKTLFTQCCLRPMIASKVIVQFGNRSQVGLVIQISFSYVWFILGTNFTINGYVGASGDSLRT